MVEAAPNGPTIVQAVGWQSSPLKPRRSGGGSTEPWSRDPIESSV